MCGSFPTCAARNRWRGKIMATAGMHMLSVIEPDVKINVQNCGRRNETPEFPVPGAPRFRSSKRRSSGSDKTYKMYAPDEVDHLITKPSPDRGKHEEQHILLYYHGQCVSYARYCNPKLHHRQTDKRAEGHRQKGKGTERTHGHKSTSSYTYSI